MSGLAGQSSLSMFKTGWTLPKKNRNAKTVLADEQKRKEELPPDTPTFLSVEAPPSLLPQKHYCAVTGLSAPYKTSTGLRFYNSEVYEFFKTNGGAGRIS